MIDAFFVGGDRCAKDRVPCGNLLQSSERRAGALPRGPFLSVGQRRATPMSGGAFLLLGLSGIKILKNLALPEEICINSFSIQWPSISHSRRQSTQCIIPRKHVKFSPSCVLAWLNQRVFESCHSFPQPCLQPRFQQDFRTSEVPRWLLLSAQDRPADALSAGSLLP